MSFFKFTEREGRGKGEGQFMKYKEKNSGETEMQHAHAQTHRIATAFHKVKNLFERMRIEDKIGVKRKNSLYYTLKAKAVEMLTQKDLQVSRNKMNRYIQSPDFMKRLYLLKLNFQYTWKLIASYFRNPYHLPSFLESPNDSFKKRYQAKFGMLLFSFIGFYFIINALKYSLKPMTHNRNNKHLEDALTIVKDLQKQNEELMMINKRLIDSLLFDKERSL